MGLEKRGRDAWPELVKRSRTFPIYPKLKLEAWAGIEPAIELLQSSALPLGYHAAR